MNLTRYLGVFAPNSKLRARIVPGKRTKPRSRSVEPSKQPASPERTEPARLTWAQKAEKLERDRELQALRNEKAAAKALRAEIKQIILQHDQRTKEARDDDVRNMTA